MCTRLYLENEKKQILTTPTHKIHKLLVLSLRIKREENLFLQMPVACTAVHDKIE